MRNRNQQDARHVRDVGELWETLWKPHLPASPSLIIDAGAANGAFSRLAKDAFPEATVWAIEANPDNIPILLENCPDCIITHAALTTEKAPVLRLNPEEYGKATTVSASHHRFWAAGEKHEKISVPQLNPWHLPTPDLIKLDIEGAEVGVLPCLTAPLIFLEWHPRAPRWPVIGTSFGREYELIPGKQRNYILKRAEGI